ncbi:MAG: agglutinin biogenesis protein MshI [Burkholderiales bacterium]
MSEITNLPNWTAFALGPQHAGVAQVERRARQLPRVRYCASFQKAASDEATLKGLRAALPKHKAAATMLLSRTEYNIHQVESPGVPRAELAGAVRWKLQEQLDYPVLDASVDVLEVPRDPNRAAEAKQLFAISARGEIIRSRIQAFHAAKLPLSVIDIPELAQRNIAQLYESGVRAVGLLVFTEEGSLLTFTLGGELLVARQFELTLSQLLNTEKENFEPIMERVALEIQRTYDHVDRRFHFAGVSRVLLSPLPAGLGVAEYLKANLSIPIEPMELSEVLDLSAVPEARDPLWQTRHLHVMGAALREQP